MFQAFVASLINVSWVIVELPFTSRLPLALALVLTGFTPSFNFFIFVGKMCFSLFPETIFLKKTKF